MVGVVSCNRHGLNVLKAKVMVRGLSAIDRRTAAARGLLSWRAELVSALGGEAVITPQRRAIVETVCRTRLFLDAIDAWLLGLPSLVISRKKSVIPALNQRQSLADSLLRQLSALGLERQAAPVMDLKDYLRQVESEATAQNGGKDGPGEARIDAEATGKGIVLPEGQA